MLNNLKMVIYSCEKLNKNNNKKEKIDLYITNDNKEKIMKLKNKLAQYFTTNIELQNKVYEFILNKPSNILEPSIGQGDLVVFIKEKIPKIKFDMYEIDTEIKLLNKIKKNKVIYGDFIKQNIKKNIKQ